MKHFTTKQAAKYLDVTISTLYTLLQSGRIKSKKVAGVYQINKRELDAYNESKQPRITHQKKLEAIRLRKKGLTYPEIANKLKMSISTAWEIINK